mmetsp:Transcript_104311/g.185460  ORF Transcript_104311/g.185460 Transcript_104311/m.185460 type:complete len:922 (-) Transcript_104311:33-2798(-)|eukprot:CAMPEP_0197632738 /NCGR_PEP_ID=MMETSP1338-20131121/9339_1 /TAXON_ID=43686 ORGANISM="Pelagodinium beii, Strain RCC1491" /NCGR_SAMPLE_ID=MMETSP1338 /ASSEMBLY_ACC=CAM_ASM_000754 /LENGTH=921 /DNA_ID=CAMNT_0043204305 /DNA_START=69 /DNA_END=2834 /DNA_ORIENTATION=-
MEKGANIKVSVADLGKALVTGGIGLEDVKDFQKIAADKTQNRLKSLKSFQALSTFKDTLQQRLEGRVVGGAGGRRMRSVQHLQKNVIRSVTGPDGSLAIENILGDKGDKYNLADLPQGRRDRKLYNRTEMQSPGDVMDLIAEEAVVLNVESPWWCQSCMQTPSCQKFCYPAEYATRHKSQQDGVDGGGHGEHGEHKAGHAGNMEDGEQHFGLQDFTQAGYALEDDDEHHWPDMLVPNQLGLVQAIHKKTSVQRLCYIKEKHELPQGVGPKEVRNLIRQLQRNDHANCLYLYEAFEDSEHLYFMYEHFPCVTLLSMLETHTWGQEEMVQIFRECCAATAHAASLGLLHLSWTLCHILIPAPRTKQPILSKVFGFGLMGVVINDSPSRICWAPECLERYHQAGVNGFLQKVEVTLRPQCDSWSLGTIVYSLVSRRPPALSEQQAQSKAWQFTLAIDDVDPEAKSLIEGLMDPLADRRLPAAKALHHEWIRRRWRPPQGAAQVYTALEDFCSAPLAKRLFGRFLTRFLDAQHMITVAEKFYALDVRGTGSLDHKELQIAARNAGFPPSTASKIHDWLASQAGDVSLLRFAETMAEDVIDGRALRHAFESLDDDGSEEVSPQELFDELVDLDDSITMDDVLAHIEEAEGGIGDDADGDGAQDHVIDYSEFVQLFPVRVSRMAKMRDRFEGARQTQEHLSKSFTDLQPHAERWIRMLDQTVLTIQDLASKAVDNRNENAPDAARSLKKYFAKIDEGLKTPPGPADAAEMTAKYKSNKSKKSIAVFGFDSFIQDSAILDNWNILITLEIKALKSALTQTTKVGSGVDAWKAHDAADSVSLKINDMLKRVKAQMEEYSSFTEILSLNESLMAGVNMSSRGLRPRPGEDEDDAGDHAGNDAAPSLEDGIGAFVSYYSRALLDKCNISSS